MCEVDDSAVVKHLVTTSLQENNILTHQLHPLAFLTTLCTTLSKVVKDANKKEQKKEIAFKTCMT